MHWFMGSIKHVGVVGSFLGQSNYNVKSKQQCENHFVVIECSYGKFVPVT